MNKIKLIIPIIIAIIGMVADHKFDSFAQIKNNIKALATPIYVISNTPFNVYSFFQPLVISQKQTQKENLILKAKLQNYNALLLENQKLNAILESSYSIKSHNFVLAKITNISQSRLQKQIIINQGSAKGIKINNVVVADKGVVGRVIQVSSKYSTIRLINDPLHYTPAINLRNATRGNIRGIANTSNNLIIKYSSPDADIKLGDIFYTSGVADVFKNSYPIGKVIAINQNSQDFVDIILSPIQDIKSTVFVLVSLDN